MSATSKDSDTGEDKQPVHPDATPAPASAPAPPSAPGFFSWILPALKTRRTIKTWIRCTLVLAGTLVLLVDNATLRTMGQAGFFAAIVSMLLPPSMALSLFVFASVTLLFGMLLGWAWGAAAMAAALSVQDKALLAQRLVAAEKAASAAGQNVSVQLQILAFQGYFLDPRSSAVYGAFLFIGAFFFGIVRARAPRLMIMGIFGTIVLDVVCSFGPLLPTAQYTIAKQFLIPTCFYLALALASLVLIFPESLNHVWLTTLDNLFFGPATAILALQSATLHTRPSDPAKWAEVAAKSTAARGGLGAGLGALGAQIGLIDMEISVGRLGPVDLKRFASEFRALGFRTAGLLAFQTVVSNVHADDKRDAEAALAKEKAESEPNTATNTPKLSHHETRFARRRRVVNEREAAHGHALDDLVPILAAASEGLRTEAEAGMKGLRGWFEGCNENRWRFFFRPESAEVREKRHAELVERRDALQRALGAWRTDGRNGLIKPYERFFDKGTGRLIGMLGEGRDEKDIFAVRSLFICFVFCDTLDAFAARLLRVLTLAVDLDERRARSRVWMPSGFGKLWRKLVSREPSTLNVAPLAMGTSTDPTRFDDEDADESSADGDDTAVGTGADEEAEEDRLEKKPAARKNPDALAPTSALGRLSVRVGSLLHFFKTPEGIFALRHAFLSVALWIPSVVPRTAWFYYSNKGLWALIMAQMGLATYAGDQLFSVATRCAGTALGLLNGMAAWYIAAQRGNGNPYAVVVVTTVFTAPFMFARVAAPPAQSMLWIMIGVTTVFVVGYSWLDTHLITIASQGVGIGLGWRRALLVAIGFTAGGIMMLFPRPTSGRTLVRRTLAAALQEVGSVFGQEVEAFLAEEKRARMGNVTEKEEEIDYLDELKDDGVKMSAKERRVRRCAQRVLNVLERLQALTPSLNTAGWEPQVQGLWPQQQYMLLHQKELKLVTSLGLLNGAFSKLNAKWCSILVHRTPFLNPNLLSDIFSTIDILSHALEAGRPIPASLPLLRERLIYHEALLRALYRSRNNASGPVDRPAVSGQSSDSDAGDSEADTHAAELVAGKVEGASIGFEELSLNVLLDDQLPTHSTAVIAMGSLLTVLDEIAAIVRELCGETTFCGFEALHHEFLDREEAAIGTRSV